MDLLTELEKIGKNMLFGKTTITFAYEFGLRLFLYKKFIYRKLTVLPNLDFPIPASKIGFWAIYVRTSKSHNSVLEVL